MRIAGFLFLPDSRYDSHMQRVRQHARWIIFAALSAGALVIWYAVYMDGGDGILRATMLDVGQGDAIFIRTPNGNQILVDGGPGRAILSELSKVMPFYDRSIDALVLSHPHADHLDGLVEVLKRYRVHRVIVPGTRAESGVYREWERLLASLPVNVVEAKRGMRILADDNVALDVLLPVRNIAGLSEHDGMLVAMLRYGETEMLFAGDMEERLERYLLTLGELPDIEVLKVGHHGSRTSSSVALLSAVLPDYALISVGEDNRYGHPHSEVIERLKLMDVPAFRTDRDGAIVVTSDGRSVNVRPQQCLIIFCR